MELSPATKVGMVAVLALIIFGVIVTEISRPGGEAGTEYHVFFQNVGGLQVRSPVLLAGVKIGYVKELQLDPNNQVNVTMLVTRPGVKLFRSRRPEDPTDRYYVYTIAGNLLGDKWLEIRPGKVPPNEPPLVAGAQVTGDPPVTLDDLAREGNQVMAEFRESVEALNELVADEKFQQDIKTTMANFNGISENLKGASGDARELVVTLNARIEGLAGSLDRVVGHVDQTVLAFQSDAQTVGQDLRGFSSGLNRLVADNQGHVQTVVTNLRQTSVSLNKTMRSLEELAENKELRGDVLAAVNNLRRTSEEVQGIASDIRSITSDPEVQGDLRETIENAKEASTGAHRVVERVEGVVEGVGGGKLAQLYLDHEWNTENGQGATNVNALILPEGSFGAKVGIDALGRTNLVNLQAMKNWDNFRVRGGVVRSQFGLGADAKLFSKRLELSLDAYDTSDPKIDVLGKVLFKGDFYLLGGVRDVTDSRNVYPIVGAGKRF